MTVTQQRIGTGITERLSVSIHGPWDEATRDWAPRVAEAYNETYIFECRAAPWERWAQEVFAKEKLPPWDKYVRICADGSLADNLPEELLQRLQDMADGSWVGDLPEDLLQRLQEIGKSGEDIKSGLALAERHPVDSQVWFACEILKSIDTVRKAMASQHLAWAVSEAMHFGELTATVSLKFNWEAAAMDGKRLLEGRPRGTKNSAQSRGETKQERQNIVRKVADELRKEDSALTKEEVISHLREKQKSDKILNEILDKVSDASLRKDLQKPEEWSTLKSHGKKN